MTIIYDQNRYNRSKVKHVRTHTIYRPQDRVYEHEGWQDTPTVETMKKRGVDLLRVKQQADDARKLATNFHIFRPIDIRSERVWSDRASLKSEAVFSITMFMDEVQRRYEGKWPKRKSPVRSIDRLAVTYFGNATIRQAIYDAKTSAYRNFGTDVKQSRDICNKLKGSFVSFLRDSRSIQTLVTDPMLAVGLLGDPTMSGQTEIVLTTDEIVAAKPDKWSATVATIGRTAAMLNAPHSKFLAFNLDQNEVLAEERQEIRDFFRVEHGLVFRDVPHEVKGQPVPNILHATWMRAADDEWRYMAADIPILPLSMPLNPPQATFSVT